MSFDIEQMYSAIKAEVEAEEKRRLEAPLVRLWDGNYAPVSEIHGEIEHSFKFERNAAGTAYVDLPLNHYLYDYIIDPEARPTKDMHLTFDKDGARWSGRVTSTRVTWGARDNRVLRLTAKHDYEQLQHIIVWANPFSLAEVQLGKSWLTFGPARWALASTLHVNLHRKNASLWQIPDDPMDFGQWLNSDMQNWNMVVKPVDFWQDPSPLTTVSSRFKMFDKVAADILDDAQLSIECRRFLEGDEPPIPGLNLKHGTLVFDIVDKSGWNTETAFGGNLLTGLQRAVVNISSDGMTESIDYIDHPDYPSEYHQPGFFGTLPEAPWVVFEDGPYTGVESTEYEYEPPGPYQFVTGGQSMPFVNETIKAGIIAVGGALGSIFAGQSQLGAAVEAIAEPLYSDTILAFHVQKMHERIAQNGDHALFEGWVDGSNRAYTISSLISMRKAKWETREKHSATIKANDAAPYRIGQMGHGDFFLSDRVAVHAKGMPRDRLFVQQVESIEYKFNDSQRGWEFEIGQRKSKDPQMQLWDKWQETATGLRDLGVL